MTTQDERYAEADAWYEGLDFAGRKIADSLLDIRGVGILGAMAVMVDLSHLGMLAQPDQQARNIKAEAFDRIAAVVNKDQRVSQGSTPRWSKVTKRDVWATVGWAEFALRYEMMEAEQ